MQAIKNRFLFTKENENLYILKGKLLDKIPGIYMMYGKSGTGKTIFLEELFGQIGKNKEVFWENSEQVIDKLVDFVRGERVSEISDNTKYVIIENIEDIRYKEYTNFIFKKYVKKLFDSGKIVIITQTIWNEDAPGVIDDEWESFCFTEVEATRDAVSAYVKLINGQLTESDIDGIMAYMEDCNKMNIAASEVRRTISFKFAKFHDFYEAYNFLVGSKYFEGQYDQCLYVEVVKVDPITETLIFKNEDDPDNEQWKKAKTQVWFEAGPPGMHDLNLNCGGRTYEEATIKLANLVYGLYGGETCEPKGFSCGVIW